MPKPAGAPRRRRWFYPALAALVAVLLVITVVVSARLGLSAIAARRSLIEQVLSRRTGRRVRIRAVAPYWNGIHPGLILSGAKVLGTDGRPLLTVPRLKASLAWSPLLFGEIAPYSLNVVRPVLTMQRRRSGLIEAGGFPIPAHATGTGSALKIWLLDQHDLSIRDGTLTWIDRAHGERIKVRHLDLTARNRFHHHVVDMKADFPADICVHCAFSLDVSGSPRSLLKVSGEARAHVKNLNVAHLPWAVRYYLPHGFDGVISARLWGRWRRGIPIVLKGSLDAHHLTLPPNRWMDTLPMTRLSGNFDWRRSSSAWVLQVRNGLMGDTDSPWQFGTLLARVGPAGSQIEISELDLDQVSWLLAHLKVQGPVFTALRQIDPDGSLHAVKIRVRGALTSPRGYWLQADAKDLTVAAYGPYPGFNGLDGAINLYRNGGAFVIGSMQGLISWPRYFSKPLSVRVADGDLSWQRTASGWRIHSNKLSLQTADGTFGTGFTLELPAAGSALIDLHGTATDVNLALIRTFYSAVPKKRLRQWLQRSIRSGMVTRGTVRLQGSLAQFPFAAGGGQFSAHARVVDGTFAFLQKWPALSGVQARLAFDGGHMAVDGHALLGNLSVSPFSVRVANFSVPSGAVVRVHGTVGGRISDTLDILRKAGSTAAFIPGKAHGHGHGALTLRIGVPIVTPAAFTLAGDYQTQNASLSLPTLPARLSRISANIRFDRTGLLGGHLVARLFGGPVTARIARTHDTPVVFLRGKTSIQSLATIAPVLARNAHGIAPWRCAVRMLPGLFPIIQFSADFKNVAMHLPPPVRKQAGVPAHLEIQTVHSGKRSSVLAAHFGDLMTSEFLVRRVKGHWSIPRGRITLGAQFAPMPRVPGITVGVFAPQLNVDHWLHLASRPGAGGTTVSQLIVRTKHLILLRRDFGAISAQLKHGAAGWSGSLSGPDADGTLQYDAATTPDTIRLMLSRLIIPNTRPPLLGPVPPSLQVNPATLPRLHLKSASLEVGPRMLGAVDFLGAPEKGGWRIVHADFQRPEGTLKASGDWYGGKAAHTQLSVALATKNLGQTLIAFGLPGQVAGGAAQAAGTLRWNGPPSHFALARLSGQLTFAAHNGRFKTLHQGAGKLLGVFDIHSIVRYLTLDFSTLFKSGYVFDHIRGALQIHHGDARTAGITVTGPSANLNIRGAADLANQQFDLRVVVDPRLSDTLTLAGASLIASPIAGAAVFLAQRVFRKQISAGTRIEYLVKGPWSKPVIHEKPDNDHD
ncbi:MAG: YhdP family protein [Acidiferrobacteraceae bacterium]